MTAPAFLTISSHNVRGFSNSREFIYSRCQSTPNLIQCIQEHWLPPPYKKKVGTNALRTVHPDFESFATSAMKKAEENKIRRGRGFGGTGFLYPKNLSSNLNPLIKYTHERVSVMELICNEFPLIIINVYMPFLDRSDLPNVLNAYDETLGFIDYIMAENPDAEFVILGDFNCNLYDATHPFNASLSDFILTRGLINTFSLIESFDSNTSYTRYDARSKSLIDYVFVSQSIRQNVINARICDLHDNHSDHLPVEIKLSLNIPLHKTDNHSHRSKTGVIWSKLSTANLADFSLTMEQALDLIELPHCILHGNNLCSDNSHKYDLELYFTLIVDAILLADTTLERSCFRALKPYWSRELSILKQQSYVHHKA